MKKLLTLLALFISFFSFSQTTSLSFTASASNPDLENYGRGAEMWIGAPWDDTNDPYIPAGNATPLNQYYRFLWGADIEKTTQGVYDWAVFDSRINAAIDAGRMFSFGVMPMCTACGFTDHGVTGLTYPQYLHNLMQAEASGSQDWFAGGDWIPNWNSPNYLGRYQALLNAIASHIATGVHSGKNYRDVIYYVDIRGYGDFGEWHTAGWTNTEPAGRKATSATRKALIDMNLAAFPNYPNVVIMGAFDGGGDSQTPTDVTYYALTKTNIWGQIGWRRDNWGDAGYDAALVNNPGSYNPGTGSVAFAPLITNKFKFAPVCGEPLNGFNEVSVNSGCPTLYCDLVRQITLYGATSFGNGNLAGSASNPTTGPAMVTNLIAASRAAGYRLALTGGNMSTTLNVGTQFNVTLNWQNAGIAPTYENWNVTFELRNFGGTTVASWISSFNPKLFLPGASTAKSDNFTLPTITTGSGFSLYVKVADPLNYKAPMFLAITGRGGDGAYLVRSGITVGSGGSTSFQPPFHVNAGPDQALSSGTTTTTLSGITPPDTVNLIIIQGESNAQGKAFNTPLTVRERAVRSNTKIWYSGAWQSIHIPVNSSDAPFPDSTGHGPENAIADLVDSGYFSGPVYIIKSGASGSYIAQWIPPGGGGFDWYTDFFVPTVDAAITALNAEGRPYRIIVWQSLGLNDRFGQGTASGTFQTKMQTLASNIRTHLGRTDVKIISTDFYNPPPPPGAPNPTDGLTFDWLFIWRNLQAADPNFFDLPVIGASYIDGNSHWDYRGFKAINRYFKDTLLLSNRGLQIGIGGPYTVLWSQVSGPNTASITSPTNETTGITGMINGTYIFHMTVTDSVGTTTADNVSVVVSGGTLVGPTAVIVPVSPITLPTSSITLTSSSTDPDGTITIYSWTNVSGPNTPTIVSPSASSTNVTGLIQGTYVFKLTVSDNHALASSVNISVVVNPAPPPTTSYVTVFTTQTSSSGTSNDGPQAGLTGIELGMKFRSSVNCWVVGVRFYKTSGNTGTHIGQLYDGSGTLLASANFITETATGWQTAQFLTPIAITANTTYVAAYFSPLGYFTGTWGMFNGSISTSPLTALASGTDGGNGVYNYATGTNVPLFPNQTPAGSAVNYWVDVIITTVNPGTAPTHKARNVYLKENLNLR